MKKIKITMEMRDEVVTLSLNTNSTLNEIIEHITKIREELTVEQVIERELSVEIPDGVIYESPDGGRTIYKRKVGTPKRELITKNRFKTETYYDMGGSYEAEVKETDGWKCSYCGENTFEVESDYLVGVDHLSCLLKYDIEKKEKG